ncbi:MAG: PH domain-containing protein, partial [Fimbriimonadales bacterium]
HPAAIVINFGVYFMHAIKGAAPGLIAIFATGGRHDGHFLALMTGGIFVLMSAFALVGPVLHYFSTRFYIEADALVISSGFVWRKRRTIPLARIQNVNVQRTIWHRLLGAASVKVETAAGRKSEGDLTALSLEDANKLQAVLLQRRGLEPPVVDAVRPPPLYALSPRQVFLAGVLGNRVAYIVAGIFSVFQFDRSETLFRPVKRYLEGLSPVAAIVAGAIAFFGLIVVGWLVSIAMSATRFWGFRIDKHERGLLLTHGLITQFRTIVPVGRIQSVRIVEPILFRLFGYCEMYAETAGTFDKKDVGAANKVCPILPEGEVGQIGKHLLPEFEFENLWWKQVSPKTVGRHALRYFILLAILFAWPLWHWLMWNALWFLIPLAIYCWILGIVSYRYVGYSFTNDILVSRTGVFRKQAVMIPFDRIQHYTIHSTWFQRRLGLATVTVMSAASGGHSIHIVDLDSASAEALRVTIGESIRRHLGTRRGGL